MQTIVTNSISEAAAFIKNGEVIAFPTETVYGLGADISNKEALQKIFKLKGRPSDNPLIVHIANEKQLKELTSEVPKSAHRLIEAYWPGPLTLVLKKSPRVNDLVSAGLSTVALRLPRHPSALALINAVGSPLAAPSANISGKPSATQLEHVLEDFDGKIPCVLSGSTEFGLESSVIDCSEDEICLLRAGSLPLEELQKVVPDILDSTSSQTKASKSPGSKYKHYAPKAKVLVISPPQEPLEKHFLPNAKIAYIGLGEVAQDRFATTMICGDLSEYASKLFAFFRDCDKNGIDTIICELPPETGLGRTIRDRLRRASQV